MYSEMEVIVIEEQQLQNIYSSLVNVFNISIPYEEFLEVVSVFISNAEPDNYVEKMRKCKSKYEENICYIVGGMIMGYIVTFCDYTDLCDIIIVHKQPVAKTKTIWNTTETLPEKKIVLGGNSS